MENHNFCINDRVEIIKGWFCSDEAYSKAAKNGILNWSPIGILVKLPSEDDEFLPKEVTGHEDLIDNFHIKLDKSPHLTNPLVTFLGLGDFKKI